MVAMKSRVIVSAVIERGDELLFGLREKDAGPYPNTYHIIGGGVKLGEESLQEALLREIDEEAGIKAEIIEQIGFDEDYEPDKRGEMTHYIFLIFKARYISGTAKPKPGEDIKKVIWVPKEKLSDIPLPRPTIKLLRKIGYL